ncbi:hypothetical protein JL721_5911 [Aureococcus anophagefferens]|nr:hypothetical protein JL721_5911 [Aureococcus anophagefferens]
MAETSLVMQGFDGESIAEKEDVFVFGGAGALDYERVDGAAKFSYAVVQTETWGGYAVYMYNPNTVDVPRQPINCASATSLSFRYKVEAPSAGRVQLRLILMDCGDDSCLDDQSLEEHWYSFFDVLGDDSGEWRTASIAPDTLTYTGWSGSADGNRIFDASTIMRWDLQWSIDGFGDVGSEEAGVVWRGAARRADTNATVLGGVTISREVGASGDAEATFALPPPAFYRLDAVTAISFLATATAAGAGVSLAVDGAVAVEADVGAAATEVSGSWSGGEITGYTVAATRLGTDGAAATFADVAVASAAAAPAAAAGSRAEDLFDDGAAPADTATGADALYTPNVNYVDGLDAKWILKKITPDTPFLGAAATSAAACAEWCHLIRDCDYFTHDARNDGVCWTFGDVAASAAADAPDGFMSGCMPRVRRESLGARVTLDGAVAVDASEAPVLLRATFALKIGARRARGLASPAIAADFRCPTRRPAPTAARRRLRRLYAVEACDAAFDGEDVDVEVDFGGLAFGCGAGTEEAADGACRDCGAGFFSNALTRCEPCPPGTHAKASGASACVACDGTSYQPDWGKAACVQCPANTAARRHGRFFHKRLRVQARRLQLRDVRDGRPVPPCDPVRQAADGVSTEVWDCADPTPGAGARRHGRRRLPRVPQGRHLPRRDRAPFPRRASAASSTRRTRKQKNPTCPAPGATASFKRCREHGRCKRNFECARGFDDLLCTDVDTREDYFGIGGFPVRCGFRKGASRSRKIAASIAAIVGVGVVWLWINFGIQAYSALNIFFANLRVFFVVSKMNVSGRRC